MYLYNLLYFLNNKWKNQKYIFVSCLLHFLIFKFILVYLLHVLFVLKIKEKN